MKISPIGICVVDAIKYVFENIRPLTLLILQIMVLTLLANMAINFLSGNNLFINPTFSNLEAALLSAPLFLLGAFITFTLALAPSLVIYRQVILGEPFEINLFKVIIQKRFWYGLWANIKVGIFLFLVIIALLITLFLAIYLGTLITHGSDLSSLNVFAELQDSPAKYIVLSAFTVLTLLIVYFAYALVIFVPVFAYIDKKASFEESWRTLKGHKLFIFGLLLVVSLAPLFFLALISFLAALFIVDPSTSSAFWANEGKSFVGLYLNTFFVAAVAISYQNIINLKK